MRFGYLDTSRTFLGMRRNVAVALAVLLAACSPSDSTESTPSTTTPTTAATDPAPSTTALPEMAVTSPAFDHEGSIPAEYTCDGDDVSPELDVVGLPLATQSVVVIVSDPDAPLGTWDHWVEFDIPVSGSSVVLPRDTPLVGVAGINSWHVEGYMGPCPPQGEEHDYFFTVYAVDGFLGLPNGVDSDAVMEAMDGLVVGNVELVGTYAR
jgi:Raf kinase inhibitor-like YbhB/YbcL family protein